MSSATSAEESIPHPSRVLLFGIIGVLTLAALVVLFIVITPRDNPASISSPFDGMEKEIVEIYGVDEAMYVSPATGIMTITMDGEEMRCFAPSDEELELRTPLYCAGGKIINAK